MFAKLVAAYNAQAAGEALVRELVPHATIFKVAQVVGIEDKFTTALAARGKRSPFIGLVNGGHNKIQPVYVRDVARGAVESLKTYDALGQTYHIAGPDVLTCVGFAYIHMCHYQCHTRFREFARVIFETMREPYSPFELPFPVAKAMGQAMDFVQKRVRVTPVCRQGAFSYAYNQAPPLPIVSPMAFSAFAEEMSVDHVVPEGALTLDNLNIIPMSCISGTPIEHIRHLRAGGYDMGTTLAETSATLPLDKRGNQPG